jgi:hypothetical protein
MYHPDRRIWNIAPLKPLGSSSRSVPAKASFHSVRSAHVNEAEHGIRAVPTVSDHGTGIRILNRRWAPTKATAIARIYPGPLALSSNLAASNSFAGERDPNPIADLPR